MNGPAWPGQPPGPPGYPPGPPPGGPGGFPPPPPPPRKGGGGFLVPVLIFAVVAVLSIAGLGAYVVLQSGDDDDPPVSLTSPEPRYSSSTGPTATPSTENGGGTGGIDDVLDTSIETAYGTTFTRAGTRTDPCVTRANDKLKAVLRDHPCTGEMHSAVYADSNKKIITAISILDFASAADAEAVKEATNNDGWPRLLTPSKGSGIPQPDKKPAYWTRTWSLDNQVIYAQSYWVNGSSPGDRDGPVYKTASQLGVEITNVLRFTN